MHATCNAVIEANDKQKKVSKWQDELGIVCKFDSLRLEHHVEEMTSHNMFLSGIM